MNPIFSPQVSNWNVIKNSRKLPITFEDFPKISEDIRRLPKTSDDFRRFHKKCKTCWKVVLSTLRHFRFFPKMSEDFRRFQKNFKNFGNLSECLFLYCPVLFPKFSKELPNIRQRRHEPLLPVTDWPLNFFHVCTLLISNHTTFLVQFEINLHSWFFQKVQILILFEKLTRAN